MDSLYDIYIILYIYISPQMDNLQPPRIQNVQSCKGVKVAKWLRKNPDASPHSLQCPRIGPHLFFSLTPLRDTTKWLVWCGEKTVHFMKSRCVFFKFGLFPFIQSQRSLSMKQGKLATASSSCKNFGNLAPGITHLFFQFFQTWTSDIWYHLLADLC